MRLCIFFHLHIDFFNIFCSIYDITVNCVYHLMFNLESHQVTACKIMTVISPFSSRSEVHIGMLL